jgi:ribulose-phosphate 3-epimerase
MIKVSASILSADFLNLETDIKKVISCDADFLHLDVMDGHFVNNITFGYDLVKSIKTISSIPLDTHLMISHPEKYVERFAKNGSNIITIHHEISSNTMDILNQIKNLGCKCGISIKPSTDIAILEKYINIADLILIMTVEPGFGGQEFIPESIERIKFAKSLIKNSGREIMLEVDGGINNKTATLVKNAGADVLVSGSYIFKSSSQSEMLEKIEFLKS